MTGPIFDTHAHYSARAFDADRDFLLDSLPGKGVVGVCEQATHSGDAPKVLELAHRYPWVVAAVGIHPESLLPAADCGEEGPAPTVSVYGGDWAAEMRALAPYYEDPKVVAVGECGLDYHWPVPKDAQLAMFEAHIRLALELDKPIIVHDRNAHADVYALLKKYQPKGIVHCYSGSADDAVWLAKQGLFIGLAGRVPSRVPSGRQKPSAPCRWKASCWRPTAPTWHRSRCAAPAVTAPSSAMWASISPSCGAFLPKRCSAPQPKMPAGYTGCDPFFASCTGFSLCFCINQQSKSKLL